MEQQAKGRLTWVPISGRTTDGVEEMAATFVEEYLRMGLSPEGVMALFRNPFYTGPHSIWQMRGEAWVEGLIRRITTGGEEFDAKA